MRYVGWPRSGGFTLLGTRWRGRRCAQWWSWIWPVTSGIPKVSLRRTRAVTTGAWGSGVDRAGIRRRMVRTGGAGGDPASRARGPCATPGAGRFDVSGRRRRNRRLAMSPDVETAVGVGTRRGTFSVW